MTERTVETQALGPDDDEGEEPQELGPLFALEGDQAAAHVRTRVYREEPIDEGHVGDVPATATEQTIRSRWGGGTYLLHAVTEGGKFLKGHTKRHLKISGEPVFDNEIGRRKYERWKTQQFGQADDDKGPPAPPATVQPTFMDLFLLWQQQAAEARKEAREQAELRAKEQEAAHQRQLEQQREEARRRESEAAEKSQRDREFLAAQHQMTLQLIQAMNGARPSEDGANGVKYLVTGMELASKMIGAGGGASDPLAAALEAMPDTIRAISETVALAKANGSGQPPAPPAGKARIKGEDTVTLQGEVGQKAKVLIEHLERQGLPAERALEGIFSAALKVQGGNGKKSEGSKPKAVTDGAKGKAART